MLITWWWWMVWICSRVYLLSHCLIFNSVLQPVSCMCVDVMMLLWLISLQCDQLASHDLLLCTLLGMLWDGKMMLHMFHAFYCRACEIMEMVLWVDAWGWAQGDDDGKSHMKIFWRGERGDLKGKGTFLFCTFLLIFLKCKTNLVL